MSNGPITFRTVLTFSICAVLAVFLGYIVASPFDWTALIVYGLVALVFAIPFLLRWHYPLLIACWNMNAVVFILPGRPPLWLLMVAVSLIFSLLFFALHKREKYLTVPQIIHPMLFLAAVVMATAELTGGVGLGSLGGAVSGGKRYFFLIGAILGYFALTCYQIKPRWAYAYISVFFLGGITGAIGNLLPLVNPAFYIIFAIFPPEQSGLEALGILAQGDVTRFGGLTQASTAIFCALLACYGIRGVLDISGPLNFLPFQFRGGFRVNKPWRLFIFLGCLVLSLFGGFRSVIITFALIFIAQFYYEKLFHTRLFPMLILAGILGTALVLPITNKLPLSFQRTLSILPVEVDPVARSSAESSTEWRLNMWKLLLPQIPQYLLLGKGYGLKTHEMEVLTVQSTSGQENSMELAMIAGDFHNGPLSVIIPFGIFGVIGFLWFLFAAYKILWRNYHYGDPHLLNLNRFLLAYFVARTIFFFFIFGSLYSDMVLFTGVVGLSVALNGGVRTKRLIPQPEAA